MPYVRIEITDGATNEQKLQIYKETTEMLARILGKNPEYTFVVIEEVASENWGHKGTSVALIRKAEAEARAAAAKSARKPGSKAAAAKRGAVAEAASLKRGPARKS